MGYWSCSVVVDGSDGQKHVVGGAVLLICDMQCAISNMCTALLVALVHFVTPRALVQFNLAAEQEDTF